jgi:hypothetical protein
MQTVLACKEQPMPRGKKRRPNNYFPPAPPGSIAERVLNTPQPAGPLVTLTFRQACERVGKLPQTFRDAVNAGLIPAGLPISRLGHRRVWPAFWFDAADQIKLDDARKNKRRA